MELHPLPVPFVRQVLLGPEALGDRGAFHRACDECITKTTLVSGSTGLALSAVP